MRAMLGGLLVVLFLSVPAATAVTRDQGENQALGAVAADDTPVYTLHLTQKDCVAQVAVNGIPVYTRQDNVLKETDIAINQFVSGDVINLQMEVLPAGLAFKPSSRCALSLTGIVFSQDMTRLRKIAMTDLVAEFGRDSLPLDRSSPAGEAPWGLISEVSRAAELTPEGKAIKRYTLARGILTPTGLGPWNYETAAAPDMDEQEILEGLHARYRELVEAIKAGDRDALRVVEAERMEETARAYGASGDLVHSQLEEAVGLVEAGVAVALIPRYRSEVRSYAGGLLYELVEIETGHSILGLLGEDGAARLRLLWRWTGDEWVIAR